MARTLSHPLRSRLRHPANVAAVALLVCALLFCALDLSVTARTNFSDENVSLQDIADAVLIPDWKGIRSELEYGRWIFYLVCFGCAGIPVASLVAASHHRVRDASILAAVVVFPALFLLEGPHGLRFLVEGPPSFYTGITGRGDGEDWSDAEVMIGALSLWVYAWLLIILPLELLARRRGARHPPLAA